MKPLAYVLSGVFNGGVPVNITRLAQTKPVCIVNGVSKAIRIHAGRVTIKNFPDSGLKTN